MSHRLAAAVLTCAVALGAAACSDDGSGSGPSSSASGQKQADQLVRSGIEQLDDGQTEAAQATFEKVLGIDSDNAYAHYNLGLIAQQAGDTDEALKQYDAALAAQPTFASALYNKAILTESTDLSAAVSLYRQAIVAEPGNAPAHMRLGFALLHLGQQTEGEKQLAAGIQLDPSMANVQAPSYD
jgi:Tfp pilus assembly protein PilF